MKIPCPKCGRHIVEWEPAPTQADNEDKIGPMSSVPHYFGTDGRISPKDENGVTWLLVKRKPGTSPSYWPAELDCHACRVEGEGAAAAWNAFLERR